VTGDVAAERCRGRLELGYSAVALPNLIFEAQVPRLRGIGGRIYAGYLRLWGLCEVHHVVEADLSDASAAPTIQAVMHVYADLCKAEIWTLRVLRILPDGTEKVLVDEFNITPGRLPPALRRPGGAALH
jgi:hypothetical protein